MLKDDLFVQVADGWNASEVLVMQRNYLSKMVKGKKTLES